MPPHLLAAAAAACLCLRLLVYSHPPAVFHPPFLPQPFLTPLFRTLFASVITSLPWLLYGLPSGGNGCWWWWVILPFCSSLLRFAEDIQIASMECTRDVTVDRTTSPEDYWKYASLNQHTFGTKFTQFQAPMYTKTTVQSEIVRKYFPFFVRCT